MRKNQQFVSRGTPTTWTWGTIRPRFEIWNEDTGMPILQTPSLLEAIRALLAPTSTPTTRTFWVDALPIFEHRTTGDHDDDSAAIGFLIAALRVHETMPGFPKVLPEPRYSA